MKMININYIDKLQTNFTIISIPINYTHLPSIKYQKICMRQNLYFKKKKYHDKPVIKKEATYQ